MRVTEQKINLLLLVLVWVEPLVLLSVGLEPHLVALARLGLWIALPIPGLTVWQKLYEGTIVHSRSTRPITEAMAVFVLADGAALWAGVAWGANGRAVRRPDRYDIGSAGPGSLAVASQPAGDASGAGYGKLIQWVGWQIWPTLPHAVEEMARLASDGSAPAI